jgi:hypothetical protein
MYKLVATRFIKVVLDDDDDVNEYVGVEHSVCESFISMYIIISSLAANCTQP